MLLLARLNGRVGVLALLCKQMHDRGPEFISAALSSLVMTARSLARGYANNPEAGFRDALTPLSGEAASSWADVQAHEFLGRYMDVVTLDDGVEVGQALRLTLQGAPALESAALTMHIVSGASELVSRMMRLADDMALEHMRGDHGDC